MGKAAKAPSMRPNAEPRFPVSTHALERLHERMDLTSKMGIFLQVTSTDDEDLKKELSYVTELALEGGAGMELADVDLEMNTRAETLVVNLAPLLELPLWVLIRPMKPTPGKNQVIVTVLEDDRAQSYMKRGKWLKLDGTHFGAGLGTMANLIAPHAEKLASMVPPVREKANGEKSTPRLNPNIRLLRYKLDGKVMYEEWDAGNKADPTSDTYTKFQARLAELTNRPGITDLTLWKPVDFRVQVTIQEL